MHRRRFLVAVGTGAVASTAGCAGKLSLGGAGSGQIGDVRTSRNAIEFDIKDSSKVSSLNVFYEDEKVRSANVNTGERTVTVSLFGGDGYSGPWNFPDTGYQGGTSYRAGEYRFVAVGNDGEEVGTAQLSLEPNLRVADVHLARDFENEDRFRRDFEVDEMGETEREKFLDASLLFEVENDGNAPELVELFKLGGAESAEVTFRAVGMGDPSADDVDFVTRPFSVGFDWELPLGRWWDETEMDLDGHPDTHILESGQSGYFFTNPFLFEKSGGDPQQESLETVCGSGTRLGISGSLTGAVSDPVDVQLSRELAGGPEYSPGSLNSEYWCREQTISLQGSSSDE